MNPYRLDVKPGDWFGCQRVDEEIEPAPIGGLPDLRRQFRCTCKCGAKSNRFLKHLNQAPKDSCRVCNVPSNRRKRASYWS